MSSDTSDAVAQLVDHLVTTGRQNIGVLAGPQYAGTAHQRLEAIRGALARHGLDLPAERVWVGDYKRDSGRAQMRRMLDERTTPEALLVSNGRMALGVLDTLSHAPVKGSPLPGDLALAAIDDLDVFTLLRPSVTAIAQPTRELGRRPFGLLLDRIAGKPVESVRIPCTLHLRASTEPVVARPVGAVVVQRTSPGNRIELPIV